MTKLKKLKSYIPTGLMILMAVVVIGVYSVDAFSSQEAPNTVMENVTIGVFNESEEAGEHTLGAFASPDVFGDLRVHGRFLEGGSILASSTVNMQFYDATNKTGICQLIDRLCSSNDTSYPRLDKTAEVNIAMQEVAGWIIFADSTWQWDDTNQTDHPIGTQTLVEGQSPYSFNDELLIVENVKVKDKDGNWRILTPIDQSEDTDALEERLDTNGLPTHYDKNGDTVRLYPAPDDGTSVTLASGLKIQYKRKPTSFTAASDTSADTKEPGFVSSYHKILGYMASIPHCMIYRKDRVREYERIVGNTTERPTGLKKAILDAYAQRQKDVKHKLIPFIEDNR